MKISIEKDGQILFQVRVNYENTQSRNLSELLTYLGSHLKNGEEITLTDDGIHGAGAIEAIPMSGFVVSRI